jgi:hypothetical protein
MTLDNIADTLENASEGLNSDWVMIPKETRIKMIERLRGYNDIGTLYWRENGVMKAKQVLR